MLFNSMPYIFIFLPASVLLYFSINKINETAGKYWLVIISLVFYSLGKVTSLPFLLASLFVNYAFSLAIRHEFSDSHLNRLSTKFFLTLGVVFNVGMLAFFKYADFFIANVNQTTSMNLSFLRMAIPLAISFYTFQQITYLVDLYRNEIKDINFLDYCIFVTFFPRLLMGPITRYNEMIPQFQISEQRKINYTNMALGLYLFFLGLCKRVVIADTFGIYADLGHSTTQSLSFAEAWITSLSYTFQIYFDFSGYTDMAIGTAYLFNIKLPFNFNSPYSSINIQDFWRRWHITLSRFLRDYIYIPLGGNRKGEISIYVNIMMTFLIGGLWHGVGWTFIIWGSMHGAALCIQRMWKKLDMQMPRVLAIFITFNFVNIAWVFFRAKSVHDALNVLRAMVGLNSFIGLSAFETVGRLNSAVALIIGCVAVLALFASRNSNLMPQDFQPSRSMVLVTSVLIVISLLFLNSSIPKGFIYNDF